MHLALVERLEPRPGEQWLDLGTGAGDVAFHAARAGAVVTASDLSPTLVETARAPRRRARPRPDARGGRLPEPPLRRRVVRCRLVVGRRDLCARPRARRARAGPGLPARRPRRPHRLAQGERRRPDVRHDAPYMPPPPPGVGSPFQWGDEDYVESMLGDAFDLSFEELDTRHDGDDAARCGRSSATTTARRSRSGRRSTTSSARPRRGHDGVLREPPRRRRHQRRAPLHRHHRRPQGLIGDAFTRAAGSRGPRR